MWEGRWDVGRVDGCGMNTGWVDVGRVRVDVG